MTSTGETMPLFKGRESQSSSELPEGTLLNGVANTVKAAIGSGLLAVPFAYRATGNVFVVVASTILITMWGCFNQLLVTECASNARKYLRVECETFGDVCSLYLGPVGSFIGSFNLVLNAVASSATYLVFISRMVQSSIFSENHLLTILLLTLPWYYGLTFLRDASIIGPVSTAGNFFIAVAIIVCLYEAAVQGSGGSLGSKGFWSEPSFDGYAIYFGTQLFCSVGVPESVSIWRSMTYNGQYNSVVIISGTICAFVYIIFGTVMWFAFGADVKPLVLDNLDGGVARTVEFSYALVIFFTLPIKILPALQTFEGLMPMLKEGVWVPLLRLVLVSLAAVVAMTVPDLTFLVAIIGSFCLGIVGLVLPPLMSMRQAQVLGLKSTWTQVAVNSFLALMGCVAWLGCSYKVIADKMNGPH
jgi:proton-coupled amino acid transporter